MRFVFVAITLAVVALSAACESPEEQIRRQNDAAASDDSAGSANEGTVSVFDLRAGDCFTDAIPASTSEHGEVETVSCLSDRASAKVLSLVLVQDQADYPAESYFDGEAASRCDLDTTSFMFPTAESWDIGDRTILCIMEL
jgi:hypothetical protein